MSTAAFTHLATKTATTKRGTTSGTPPKRGAPAAYITTPFACLPLDPLGQELANRLNLQSPYELKQTVVDGSTDIVEGDVLTVDGVDYPVRSVGEWDWTLGSTRFLTVVVEQMK